MNIATVFADQLRALNPESRLEFELKPTPGRFGLPSVPEAEWRELADDQLHFRVMLVTAVGGDGARLAGAQVAVTAMHPANGGPDGACILTTSALARALKINRTSPQ